MKTLLTARMLLNLFIFVPFVVLFAVEIGMNVNTIMFVESIFAILIVLFDIPFGHIADRIGPRGALQIGAISQASASLLLFIFPTPIVFLAVQVLYAFALTISRGADSALTFLILEKNNKKDLFQMIEERFLKTHMGFEATVFFIAGMFAYIGISYSFLATGILHAIAFLVLFFTPTLKTNSEHNTVSLNTKYSLLKRAINEDEKLIRLILSIFFIGGVFSSLIYLIPIILQAHNFSHKDVGTFFAVGALLAFLSSSIIDYIFKFKISPFIVSLLALIGMYSTNFIVLIIAFAALKWCQSILIAKFRKEMIFHLGKYGETTAASVVSTFFTLGLALIGPFWGFVVDLSGVNALISLSIMSFIIGVYFS